MFSTQGRINRVQWWIRISIITIVLVLLNECTIVFLGSWKYHRLVWIPLGLPFLWVYFTINTKRHHDQNRSTFLTAVMFILAMVLFGIAIKTEYTSIIGYTSVLWLVYFGFLRGNKERNKYGEPSKIKGQVIHPPP